MKKKYDTKITRHYNFVAEEEGIKHSSTMKDEYTRQTETDAIISFIEEVLRQKKLKVISNLL
jgi:hypothetical protein